MANAQRSDAEQHLTPHDGREVLTTSVKITKAGDGLSKALGVDPIELHHGQTVVIALECEVGPIGYVPIKDTNALMRLHTLETMSATLIDEDVVRDALEAQRQRIDASNGVFHLPFGAAPVPAEDDDLTDEEWDDKIAAAEAQEAAEDAAAANES